TCHWVLRRHGRGTGCPGGQCLYLALALICWRTDSMREMGGAAPPPVGWPEPLLGADALIPSNCFWRSASCFWRRVFSSLSIEKPTARLRTATCLATTSARCSEVNAGSSGFAFRAC